MSYIYRKIRNHSNKKYVFTLFFFSILLLLLMESSIFGLINFKTKEMIDTIFLYSKEDFIKIINSLDSLERTNYFRLHVIDYGFIISFYPLLSILLYRGLKQCKLSTDDKWRNIAFIPLLALLLDLSENLIIDFHLKIFTEPVMVFSYIIPVVTLLKFTLILCSLIFIVTLTLKTTLKK